MSRLCRFGLLVVCIAGWVAPTSVEAQVFPWAYDTMYPSQGYTSYYTGSSYSGAPYVTGYAPGAGCGCQQSYYGYSYGGGYGCSSCGGSCGVGCASGNCGIGCASGNCASGNCASGNCSTTVNSSASGMTPTPDPLNSARSIENRLDAIEKTLKIAPPKNRTYEDNFGPSPGRTGTGTTIPNRPRNNSNDDAFQSPIPGRQNGTNDNEPFQENPPANSRDAFKANTGSTLNAPGNSDTVIPGKKPAPGPAIDDADDKKNQTLRLDTQITSRAVSPRERQSISVGFAKAAVASSKKASPTLQLDAKSDSVNVARK